MLKLAIGVVVGVNTVAQFNSILHQVISLINYIQRNLTQSDESHANGKRMTYRITGMATHNTELIFVLIDIAATGDVLVSELLLRLRY